MSHAIHCCAESLITIEFVADEMVVAKSLVSVLESTDLTAAIGSSCTLKAGCAVEQRLFILGIIV